MLSKPLYDLKSDLGKIDAIYTISNVEIDFFEINETEYKAKHITVKDSDFTNLVLFNETEFSHGLFFEGCCFKKPLIFQNIKVSHHDTTLEPESTSLRFRNCTFNQRVEFSGNETRISQNLRFEDCIFEKDLQIKGLNSEHHGIEFNRTKTKAKIEIYGCNLKGDLFFENCEALYNAHIQHNNANHIGFIHQNKFLGPITLNENNCAGGLIFNDGDFKENIFVSGNSIKTSGLVLIDSTFHKTFYVEVKSSKLNQTEGISEFYINGVNFGSGLEVLGTRDIFADYQLVEILRVDFNTNLTGNMLFSRLDVRTIEFSGYNVGAKINLKFIRAGHLKIKDFTNEGSLIFTSFGPARYKWTEKNHPNLIRDTALYISDSSLGKAHFFQCDFESFESLGLYNVTLTEVSTSNVKWFLREKLEGDMAKHWFRELKKAQKIKNKIEISNARMSLLADLRTRREIYRQLKFAMNKQGDIPQALMFQRDEMHYYKRIVQSEASRRWSEYLILFTSQTNDFGQNWLRALVWLIGSAIVLYLPIAFLCSDQLDYTKFARDWSDVGASLYTICENIRVFPILLNPAHRIKDFSENIDKFPVVIYFFDLISRIVISFFIFQMVSAFRKFNK